MKLSIIIINWNTKDLVKKTIESIKDVKCTYEIILVDNNSQKPIDDLLKVNPYIKLIKNSSNLYFAKANNQALSISRGEYILLLGSDTRVLKDSINKMIAFLDNRKEYDIVAPQILNSDKTIQKSCRNFPTLINVIKSFFDFSKKSKFWGEYKLSYWDHNNSQDVKQPQATCILIRKSILDKFGLFDSRFPLYFNDVDFFKRMDVNGIKTYFLKDAQIIHHYGQSTKKLGVRRRYFLIKGYISYIFKWGIF